MSWTDPRTWVTDEIPTSSQFNTHIRDNLRSLPHRIEQPTVAALEVTNTVVETTLYSVLVPGGAMGTHGEVQCILEGDYLYNNSIADELTVRVKFGGVTIASGNTLGAGSVSATRKAWHMELTARNLGSESAQWVAEWDDYGNGFTHLSGGDGTVNTASDQTLSVTVQWTAASANNAWRRKWAKALLAQN